MYYGAFKLYLFNTSTSEKLFSVSDYAPLKTVQLLSKTSFPITNLNTTKSAIPKITNCLRILLKARYIKKKHISKLNLTIGVSEPPHIVKPMPLSFSFWNSIVVSLPTWILQSFGSCGGSGSFGFSGSFCAANTP